MRVGLIGFGRTGRAVAAVVLRDPTLSLAWVVRQSDVLEHRLASEFLGEESSDPGLIYPRSEFAAAALLEEKPVDVIIDFSSPAGLSYYGVAAAERGVAIVTAVSNYPDSAQRELRRLSQRTAILWSPNITLGINFIMLAAQTLQRIAPTIDVQIVEEHFREKSDVSGTALRLASALQLPRDHVHSLRAGGIIGVHEVLFGFPAQTVRVRHETTSREAFGNGAVFAARRLVTEPPGLYRMEELLVPYFVDPRAHSTGPTTSRVASSGRGRVASWLRRWADRVESSVDPANEGVLPAPSDPFVEVGTFGTNRGGGAVAGPDDGVGSESSKEPVLN